MNDNLKKFLEFVQSWQGQKGQGSLYNTSNGRFCFWGLACLFYQIHHPRGLMGTSDHPGRLDEETDEDGNVRYDGESEEPPERVLEWLGMKCDPCSHGPGEPCYKDIVEEIMGKNDSLEMLSGKSYSFHELAWILRDLVLGYEARCKHKEEQG